MKASCFDYAASHISRFPKTTKQLRDFLQRKGYPFDDVIRTLERLTALGLLDDDAYARMTLQSEVCRKGKPLFVVRQKLLFKGIDKARLAKIEEDFGESLNEGMRERVAQVGHRLAERGYDQMKIVQNLTGRGYPYELVKEMIIE